MACDPLRDLRAWQERLQRLAHPHPEPGAADRYLRTAGAYIITVEVPGVTREDVELAVEEFGLVIRGRRAEERDRGGAAGVRYHLVERGYGAFNAVVRVRREGGRCTRLARPRGRCHHHLAESAAAATAPNRSPLNCHGDLC